METARAISRTETCRCLGALLLMFGLLAACSPQQYPATSIPVWETPTTKAPAPVSTEIAPSPTLQGSATPLSTPTLVQTHTPDIVPSPTLPPSPTPLACWSEGGNIIQHTLRTPISPLPWEYRIYTPPCYDQQDRRRYPLLILIHGSTFNDDQWDRLGADETADLLIANGELTPFLILMPRDRIWTDEPRDDPFGQALIEYLIPWVDEHYRTLPERPYRAIGGLSRGASWAIHLGLSHWEMFGSIGGHSLPVFVTDPPRLKRWLDEIPKESLPRFFLDIGEKDYLLENAIWFENLLTEKNIPHEWYLFTGRHEEAYWQAHLEQYLRWYAESWSHLE